MAKQKPQNLYTVLAQRFTRDDMEDLALEIGLDDVGVLEGSLSRRARFLVDFAGRRKRTDKLLGYLLREAGEEPYFDYLYLLACEHYSFMDDVKQLSAALGIDYQKQLVDDIPGLFSETTDPHWIEEQVWTIYVILAEAGRLGELVYLLKEKRPHLDLAIFETRYPPTPPNGAVPGPAGLPDWPEMNGGQAPGGLTYDDFDLRINEGRDGVYEVEVLRSPRGEVRKTAQAMPLDDAEFKDLLAYLKDLWAGREDARKLGEQMRGLLFPGEVWSKFRECLPARGANRGLRLRLRIDPPELSGWPWEYIWHADFDYLAHSKLTPVVRYPAESLPQEQLQAELPIRILLVTANPQGDGWKALQVDKEEGLVHQALEPLTATGLAEVDVIRHAQITDVNRKLREGRYHVFHFIGHGKYDNSEGHIVLEDDAGGPRLVAAAQLRALLRNSEIKFIFLNACETAASDGIDPISGVARSMIRAGIPAVMAMQFEVPDKTSLLLSENLYRGIVLGRPLDQAVTEMRSAAFIEAEDMVYWGIPVLYMRAPDGVIWQADATAAAKLAAFKPESALVKALRRAAAAFPAVQGTLDAAAIAEFEADLQAAQAMANGAPDDMQRRRITLKLNNLVGLLEVFGVAADSEVLQALAAAKAAL
ncbi:MAG: CHAT domain-containing protein [Anaerolineales bacterium]|nr:CHAT domain-containing protein [Anaerolineales bacterium]